VGGLQGFGVQVVGRVEERAGGMEGSDCAAWLCLWQSAWLREAECLAVW